MIAMLVVATWAIFSVAAGPASADPTGGPFETITGTLAPGDDQNFSATAPLATAHRNVIVRFAVSGPGATGVSLDNPAWSPEGINDAEAGEVIWTPMPNYDYNPSVGYGVGDTPTVEVSNNGATSASFEIDMYDVPSAPVAFSGASFDDTAADTAPPSDLQFVAPGAAPYVANVTITSGAISVSTGSGTQTMTSPGQVSLGKLSAGVHDVTVVPLPGPLAQWQVTVTPVPIQVSNVSFSSQYAPAGVPETLAYSLDGDATITATIRNSMGIAVRSLADSFAVPYTQHPISLTWDGRDESGNAVPDGTYTATISSIDPVGNQSLGTASMIIDSTPPLVSLAASQLKPDQAAVVNFRDPASGVKTASADFGAGVSRTLQGNQTQLSYAPQAGWASGRHTVVVSAIDRAGNQLREALMFTVAAPTPQKQTTLARYGGRAPVHATRLPSMSKWTACGLGLGAGPNTSCAFANNVYRVADTGFGRKGYWPAWLYAQSPVTHQTYSVQCYLAKQPRRTAVVICKTETGGVVSFPSNHMMP
jgi:hypothetical protein